MENLQLNLTLGTKASGGGAPDQPQFTADWGNIYSIDAPSPTIFWASTTGAQTNVANATTITFSGLSRNISVDFLGDAVYSIIRYRKNGGATTTPTGPVSFTNGDTLNVGLLGYTVQPANNINGNLIVYNSTDSYTIDTIPFEIVGIV